MAEDPGVFDPRVFLKAARQATRELCAERFIAFGSAGWAARIKPVSLDVMAKRYGY
jgi:fructose-bisphosphate aldolase class II